MVTKRSSTNLLSRFVQLFRESAADDGSDSRQPAPAVVPARTDIALKQLLRRRMRNDSIRATELNQLRSILQRGRAIGQRTLAEAPTPSQLMRTSILDKIDGVEAHLAQWWGTTLPAPVAPGLRAEPLQTPGSESAPLDDDMDLDFTGLGALTGPESAPLPLAHPTPAAPAHAVPSALDLCLREAAPHYANADFSAAYQLLSGLLRDPTVGPDAAEILTFALFDVYRCTGQQDPFDALALDYAKRFGRSPGEWFSLADTADTKQNPQSPYDDTAAEAPWQCPNTLDRAALADCLSRNPAAAPHNHIHWEALQHIDNATAPELAAQIKAWCAQPVELHWTGLDALIACVQQSKARSDTELRATWWLLHLDLLRLQQRAQACEEMALDYCIALEVSPPDWQPTQCLLVQGTDFRHSCDFAATAPYGDFDESVASRTPYAVCDIQGHLTGDAGPTLRALRAASRNAGHITVSCSRLGRVDFDAASALIRWATASKAQGCQVQFTQLPRLVLVLLDMLGMANVAVLLPNTR